MSALFLVFCLFAVVYSLELQDLLRGYKFGRYRKLFNEWNKNKDHQISLLEFLSGHHHPKLVPSRLKHFEAGDRNDDDYLDFYEFQNTIDNAREAIFQGEYKDFFNFIDKNNDGEVTFDEHRRNLKKLKNKFNEQQYFEKFKKEDLNKNGVITPEETRAFYDDWFESYERKRL